MERHNNLMAGRTGVFTLDDQIYLKCEWQNLTGTPKARLINQRISRLEMEGNISPGMTLYDVSTGSEAAALAQFGSILGYNVRVWLPDYVSTPFKEYVRRFGAEVEIIDRENWLSEGSRTAMESAESDPAGFYFNQADAMEDAIEAYSSLGEEFAGFFRSVDIRPDALISVIGTGGLLLGTFTGLKKMFPEIDVYAVELESAPHLHSALYGYEPDIISHRIWGISCEGSTRMKDRLKCIVKDVILIEEGELVEETSKIPENDGISVGYPTAGNIIGARRLLKRGVSTVATIWSDHGWRTLVE